MAFAAARMILKDKRRKSKEEFTPARNRSKVPVSVFDSILNYYNYTYISLSHCDLILLIYYLFFCFSVRTNFCIFLFSFLF